MDQLTKDCNNRIAFQLLSSAFVQIQDEDAKEILGTLANKALKAIRGKPKSLRQQEWRVWMGPIDERNGTWWREYTSKETQ